MEAKEFRKGNYVQDVVSGEWMIIDEIGENIGAVIINRDKYPLPDGWQMGLIPLTPEILEKAGFHKNRIGNLAIELNDMATHLELTQVDEKYFPAIDQLQDIGTPQNVALNYIEYVHQLQNLYFTLTGEELKIEL